MNNQADIEHMLSYLSLCEDNSFNDNQSISKFHKAPLSLFREAEPFDIMDDNDDSMFFSDAKLSDLDKPLDMCVMRSLEGKNNIYKEFEKDKYIVYRLKEVEDPRRIRANVHTVYPIMIESLFATLCSDGSFRTQKDYFTPIAGKWQCLTEPIERAQTRKIYKDFNPELHNRLLIMPSVQFTRRYNWRVEVGYQGLPSLSLVMSPEGILEAFKFRDIPAGKKRRSALRHWVESFWRKKSTTDEKVQVRKHLRGNLTFTMDGLNFRIIPSDFDLQQNNELKLRRREIKIPEMKFIDTKTNEFIEYENDTK